MNIGSNSTQKVLGRYRESVATRPAEAALSRSETNAGGFFEVSCRLQTDEAMAKELLDAWTEIGEGASVSGGVGAWDCLVRTQDPGIAIELAVAVGRPYDIRILEVHGPSVGDTGLGFVPIDEAITAPVGVVPVAAGGGLVDLFRRLGAQGVVAGGRPLRPTVEELVAMVEDVAADIVVVLPNNKNLIPIAEELDSLTTKKVIVVPTRSIPQGISAMFGYTPGSTDAVGMVDDMAAAASAVVDGEITPATRDAVIDSARISKGEWLGIADGTIVVNDPDLETALRGLVAAILPPGAEFLTLYYGVDSKPATRKALVAWLDELHPELRVELVDGGQPLHPYLVAIE